MNEPKHVYIEVFRRQQKKNTNLLSHNPSMWWDTIEIATQKSTTLGRWFHLYGRISLGEKCLYLSLSCPLSLYVVRNRSSQAVIKTDFQQLLNHTISKRSLNVNVYHITLSNVFDVVYKINEFDQLYNKIHFELGVRLRSRFAPAPLERCVCAFILINTRTRTRQHTLCI